MKKDEIKNLSPREFSRRAYELFRDRKISPAELKALSEFYCRNNNIKLEGKNE